MPVIPLVGPYGGPPNMRQIADTLIANMGYVEALQIFQSWVNSKKYDTDEAYKAFSLSIDTAHAREARIDRMRKPGPVTGEALRAMDLPPIEWIIDSTIPKNGLVAVSGRPGSHKTFYALWLALRASQGLMLYDDCETMPFCPLATIATPTLFIEEENSLILTRERLLSFRLHCPKADNLFFRVGQCFKLQDPVWRSALIEDIAKKSIGLIIMDPFSSVMGLENENDNAEVSVAMDLLRHEFADKGVTIVLIHHPSKGDGEGKNLRGAGDILGKVDVHIHLEKDELDKRLVTISYEKMRLINEEAVANHKIRLAGDDLLGDLRYRYIGEAKSRPEEAREVMKKQILETMQPAMEYTREEIADMTGTAPSGTGFRKVWSNLISEKLIRHPFGSRKFIKS